MNNRKETYDFICFSELAYEWDASAKKNTETKIRKRLRSINQGYDPQRIDYIRSLRNDLYNEISLSDRSEYFTKSTIEYADLADFRIIKCLLILK